MSLLIKYQYKIAFTFRSIGRQATAIAENRVIGQLGTEQGLSSLSCRLIQNYSRIHLLSLFISLGLQLDHPIIEQLVPVDLHRAHMMPFRSTQNYFHFHFLFLFNSRGLEAAKPRIELLVTCGLVQGAHDARGKHSWEESRKICERKAQKVNWVAKQMINL